MQEVLSLGLKSHWIANGHLAGVKTDTVIFAVRMLDDTEFADQFEEASVPVTLDNDTANPNAQLHAITNHIMYPESGYLLQSVSVGLDEPSRKLFLWSWHQA